MKRKGIKGIIKLIAFLLILLICFKIIYNITDRKAQYGRTQEFFNQEENFDVLFLGSSHTMVGVFPMDLWNDYGIISYNLGMGAESIATSYYKLLLSLEYTKPKLVVIDAFFANKYEKIEYSLKEHIHNSLDVYPLSYTKYIAIKDLFSEHNIKDSLVEYLFDFSIYHSRWKELNKNDFMINYSSGIIKGAAQKIDIFDRKSVNRFDLIKTYNGKETVSMEYLRKIIEYCQQNKIEILVTNIPYKATDSQISISKYVSIICDEYNVNHINFLGIDIVDYKTDYADSDSHLNPSGARKVTNYLGKYIMENYDIRDQRNNDSYSFWYKDYNEYIDYKIRNLKNNKDNLNNYLMLLYGEKDIKYEIKISSKREIKEETTLYNLLENLGNNYRIDDSVFEDKEDKTIKITTWDKRDSSLINKLWW